MPHADYEIEFIFAQLSYNTSFVRYLPDSETIATRNYDPSQPYRPDTHKFNQQFTNYLKKIAFNSLIKK
jgi:hypothetical protein